MYNKHEYLLSRFYSITEVITMIFWYLHPNLTKKVGGLQGSLCISSIVTIYLLSLSWPTTNKSVFWKHISSYLVVVLSLDFLGGSFKMLSLFSKMPRWHFLFLMRLLFFEIGQLNLLFYNWQSLIGLFFILDLKNVQNMPETHFCNFEITWMFSNMSWTGLEK